MRRFFKLLASVGLALMAAYNSAVHAKADYPLVLIGGGLSFCTSQSTRECLKPLKLDTDVHVDYTYQVTQDRIKELSNSNWLANRQTQQSLAVMALKQVAEQTTGVLTKRQLLTALRALEIGQGETKVRGTDFLQSLMEEEYFLILDILQKSNVEENLLSSNEHRKIKVAVKNSKSYFSQKVLRAFLHQVNATTQGKTPNIVIVTSAQRDPFESVDLYQQIFTQLGAKVQWLPLDRATYAAIAADKQAPDSEVCQQMESFRQKELGLYARDRIFPKLHKQQMAFCQAPQQMLDILAAANGVFFVSGSPVKLKHNMVNQFALSNVVLQQLKQRLLAANIVVGADEGAAMALASEQMLVAGKSHQALLGGVVESEVSLNDCDKAQRCPKGFQEGQVSYQQGGIGLFPFGVIDTQFSELGRQGRLVKLLGETNGRMGYGIDERTALLVGIDQDKDIPVRMEVLGENGVAILDASEVELDQGFGKSLLSIRSHYLTDEDKLFFRNSKLIISFADWKYSSNNSSTPVIKSGRVFSRDNYRRTLTMLCSTGASSASMKHVVLGKGHSIYVTKSRTSISLAGKRNVVGTNYNYCSYRDYYIDISPL